jgi:hypothetical protein
LQGTRDALADKSGRATQLARDVWIVALFKDTGAQCLILRWGKPAGQLHRHIRLVSDGLYEVDVAVLKLERIEREQTPGTVLDLPTAVTVDELAVGDREKPSDRNIGNIARTVVNSGKSGSERLGREVGGELRRAGAVPVKGQHSTAVAAIEDIKATKTAAAGEKQGAIVARVVQIQELHIGNDEESADL